MANRDFDCLGLVVGIFINLGKDVVNNAGSKFSTCKMNVWFTEQVSDDIITKEE